MTTAVALFDADGVLTVPNEMFSNVYARSHGLDPEPFHEFFRTEWKAIVTGEKDLKESISENAALWQWSGTVDDLLDSWFRAEDVRNEELISVIGALRSSGLPCYLATEQERYRGEYMRQVMFGGVFDGYFITAELGVPKDDPRFFELIIETLRSTFPEIEPRHIAFFDDSPSKVDAARSVGIDGRLYTNAAQVQALLPPP